MTRLEENTKVREFIDNSCDNEEIVKQIEADPKKGDSFNLVNIVMLLADISKSLATISDTLTEFNDE